MTQESGVIYRRDTHYTGVVAQKTDRDGIVRNMAGSYFTQVAI